LVLLALDLTGLSVCMSDLEMASFLASVEQKAFAMAMLALKNREQALDTVQEAMLQLVQRYRQRPAEEWPPLFHRILQNAITDQHRRRRWSQLIRPWRDEADEQWCTNTVADPQHVPQAERLQQTRALNRLQQALQNLPRRQQQAYLLRHWQGLDVKATAQAMQCSEGSVKTHLSRALTALKIELAQDWP
jgi:RNA polymerase sigma-70 factor, ECF subfamily